jgi:hypothetical protein
MNLAIRKSNEYAPKENSVYRHLLTRKKITLKGGVYGKLFLHNTHESHPMYLVLYTNHNSVFIH